ncbi:TPA: hypothetical protein ACG5DM_006521 [Pseudomonas putida]|jgi:hypothetical protein|uniref:Uncharacterized protein n=2 Tax=Pseudomonas TaxID=286 RepID=A0AAJ5S990_9PSED|nr:MULTISPECIES: hypothetical protein [Pseudomonas]MCT8164075.1 hypothetical protein [Pseudomonas sp. HD6422]MCT8182937.1 hypothetical protein [Pseudomonas sp. HD6421]MDH1930408.1 hypothetical protein [Pseudomonas sp. GD03696]MDM1711795.1 hypothetical protein [Pseudomonas sp. 165]ORL53093.1 hypothetical protein B7H18_03680 [Pseudomonas putida]
MTMTESDIRAACMKYMHDQIGPLRTLWEAGEAAQRVIGFIDACQRTHKLSADVENWLRNELKHTHVNKREDLLSEFHPIESKRRHDETPEAAVNWWCTLSARRRAEWLAYLDTQTPLDCWDEYQRVQNEYEQRWKKSSVGEANKWLYQNIPRTLW